MITHCSLVKPWEPKKQQRQRPFPAGTEPTWLKLMRKFIKWRNKQGGGVTERGTSPAWRWEPIWIWGWAQGQVSLTRRCGEGIPHAEYWELSLVPLADARWHFWGTQLQGILPCKDGTEGRLLSWSKCWTVPSSALFGWSGGRLLFHQSPLGAIFFIPFHLKWIYSFPLGGGRRLVRNCTVPCDFWRTKSLKGNRLPGVSSQLSALPVPAQSPPLDHTLVYNASKAGLITLPYTSVLSHKQSLHWKDHRFQPFWCVLPLR